MPPTIGPTFELLVFEPRATATVEELVGDVFEFGICVLEEGVDVCKGVFVLVVLDVTPPSEPGLGVLMEEVDREAGRKSVELNVRDGGMVGSGGMGM